MMRAGHSRPFRSRRSLVYTTAEIAVGELTALAFSRELDPKTTYKELAIRKR